MDIFDFMPSLQESQSLVLAIDAVHPRDYTERIHVGGEYWYMDMIALRAGLNIIMMRRVYLQELVLNTPLKEDLV